MKTLKITLITITLLLLSFSEMYSQNSGFRKNPWILLKDNSLTVMWQLYTQQNCTFKYKLSNAGTYTSVTANNHNTSLVYNYAFTNLGYSTAYDYIVELADGSTYSGSFISPPDPNDTQVSFYGYGDTRGGDNSSDHSLYHNDVCNHILNEINTDPLSQTLLIHTGDWNCRDGEDYWDNQYFYKMDNYANELRSKIGVTGCIGNHEANSGEAPNFRKYWPYNYPNTIDDFWRSYNYGPVHFCFADQRLDYSILTDSSAQKPWIKQNLKNSNKLWKVMVFHPPVYTWDYADYNTERDFYNKLFNDKTKYGINLVLNGHVHVYSDWLVNGVHHLTLGGGGAIRGDDGSNGSNYTQDPTNPNIIKMFKGRHFAKFDVHNNYIRVTIHFYNENISNWDTLDKFIIPHSFTIKDGENVTWENLGAHYYADKIVVKQGGVLTIKGDVEFERDGLVIVEPGGKLIIDDGYLTCLKNNQYVSSWQGIQVYGNPNASQYPDANGNYAQGVLIMKNGATIENAINAVALQNSDQWGHEGGIIYASDAHFINNRRSVEFLSYQNTFPPTGEVCDNVSRFTNCDFVYNDSYNIPTAQRTHVTMWKVDGVKFYGCTFTDEMTNPSSGAYGIYTIDAGFRVDDYCNAQVQPCPANNILRSIFKSFDTAVYAANTEKPYSFISVKNSNFENNGVGIDLGLAYGSVIVNNTFKLGAIADGCNNKVGIGVSLDNSKLFAVEENTFTLTNNAPPAHYIGIRTINTNSVSDQIYKNYFDHLIEANRAEGKNWSRRPDWGLAYFCNQNQNNSWDFTVLKRGPQSAIQTNQGIKDELVAGNTFTPNATKQFYNNGILKINYYYEDGNTQQTPDINLLYRVNSKLLKLSNPCPSHYTNGGDIQLSASAYQQRETDYNNASASFSSASVNYDAASDSATQNYWADKMSYYNLQKARAAYDIIRSNMADTIAHLELFKTWMEKLDTYTSAEAMVDYYMEQGDYSTALNKVDSLPYRFTFTAYDSIEYPLYSDFKHKQATWLADGRTLFDLTTSEINSLIAIADSSKGTAGAQARAILRFAYPSQYSYIDCIGYPGSSIKSAELNTDNNNENHSTFTVTVKPNPAHNNVTFRYTLPDKTETALLNLYNTTGKIIYTALLTGNANKLQYNCSQLKAGVYYYKVSTTNQTVSGKWVIVR